jgi:hypothetical protein
MRALVPRASVLGVSILLVIGLWFLSLHAPSDFMVILTLVVLFGLSASAALDVYALYSGSHTIGDGIQGTTRRFGLYRAGLALFLGALLGHLFWASP